jgi:hypothetical protein
MKHDPQLVDLEELKTLMTGVNLNDANLNEYINARWLKYVEWWDWRSRQAKRKYQASAWPDVPYLALVAFSRTARLPQTEWRTSALRSFTDTALEMLTRSGWL